MTQYTNNALDTLNSLASGASAPSSSAAGQLWHDTTNNLLKIRSLDNTTWIPLLQLNESAYSALPYFPAQITGSVNRVINGDMLIDQFNEGATYSVTNNNTPTYTDKFIVVDGETVETGSFNFTAGAEKRNAENVVVLNDPAIAEQYGREWERLWSQSEEMARH